jgi:hypothetical protein
MSANEKHALPVPAEKDAADLPLDHPSRVAQRQALFERLIADLKLDKSPEFRRQAQRRKWALAAISRRSREQRRARGVLARLPSWFLARVKAGSC